MGEFGEGELSSTFLPLDRTRPLRGMRHCVQKIVELEMAPYYEDVCQVMSRPIDESLLAELKEKNKERLDKFEEDIKVAEENEGPLPCFASQVDTVLSVSVKVAGGVRSCPVLSLLMDCSCMAAHCRRERGASRVAAQVGVPLPDRRQGGGGVGL